jgi:phage virion morphogenesis protein
MENEFKSPEIIEILKEKLRGNRGLMLAIAEEMRVAVLKNFETEGARLGKKWASLKKSTIKQRESKGYWPGKILQRTGQLKNSIISRANETSAEVSTNLIYAAIHQYGGWIHRSSLKTYLRKKREGKAAKEPRVNTPNPSMRGEKNKMSSFYIPARPFMKLNERDIEKIKELITKAIMK